MADVYEQNLGQKSSLTTSDFIRVVGSDNVSYKQLVSDVADKILQAYPTSTAIADVQAWAQAHNGFGIASTNANTANLPSGMSYGVAWCNNYVYGSNAWCNLFWSPTNSNDIYQCRKQNAGAWSAWEKMPTRAEVDALKGTLKAFTSSSSATFTLASNKYGSIYILSGSECGVYFANTNASGTAYVKEIKSLSGVTVSASGSTITVSSSSLSGTAIFAPISL